MKCWYLKEAKLWGRSLQLPEVLHWGTVQNVRPGGRLQEEKHRGTVSEVYVGGTLQETGLRGTIPTTGFPCFGLQERQGIPLDASPALASSIEAAAKTKFWTNSKSKCKLLLCNAITKMKNYLSVIRLKVWILIQLVILRKCCNLTTSFLSKIILLTFKIVRHQSSCLDVTGLNFLNHKPIPQTSKTENSSTEAKKAFAK